MSAYYLINSHVVELIERLFLLIYVILFFCRHQLWRLPDQLYQNMDLQMQMPYLGSSFKEKQMCRKIVSKLVR